MKKLTIALIVLVMMAAASGAAYAGQDGPGWNSGKAVGLAAAADTPPVFVAAKEWNENQRSVVESFQNNRSSSGGEFTFVYYLAAIFAMLALLYGLFRKR